MQAALFVPSARSSPAHFGALKDPFAKFVDAAIARVRRDVDLDDHAAEVVTYLSKVVGRELPQPEPRQVAEEVDEPEVDDDAPELSREPKERVVHNFQLGKGPSGRLLKTSIPAAASLRCPTCSVHSCGKNQGQGFPGFAVHRVSCGDVGALVHNG